MSNAKPKSAARTRLANALAHLKRLTAENDLRAGMFATSQEIVAKQGDMLIRAAGLMRSAADQLDVRQAQDTARHLRAEADKLGARDHDGAAQSLVSASMGSTLKELAART